MLKRKALQALSWLWIKIKFLKIVDALSVLTAMALCIITYHQFTITKTINEPFFAVNLVAKQDSNGIFSTKYMLIENSGGEARDIRIAKRDFYKVTYYEDFKTHGPFYIPAVFYFASFRPNLSRGLVYESYTYHNNVTLHNFRLSLKDPDRFYQIDDVVFVRVSYTTIFGDRKSVYFCNEQRIDKIPKEIATNSEYISIDIDRLTQDLLEKYINNKQYITISE